MLPETIRTYLAEQHTIVVQNVGYCGGGDINEARRLDTPDGPLFIKWNINPIDGMFTAEARGLALLNVINAVRVPQPLLIHEADEHAPAFLLLEWLEAGPDTHTTATRLGEQVATLHHHAAKTHGLDHDNFIGSLPQYNHQSPSWITFYGQQRLYPQIEMAGRNGELSSKRKQRLEWLNAHLDRFLPDETAPSLLHGDLWRGNVMVLSDGHPALIDPAVYYGHFEVELAFTELLGGFSSVFYDAYWANTHFDRRDYAARRPVYQLYPLLVHLNLFGGSYARRVDAILDQLGVG